MSMVVGRRLAALVLLLGLLVGPAAAAAMAAPANGRVEEFKLGPGTHAQSLVAGPDGNLWFAGIGSGPAGFADVVGKVTPGGQVTEFPLGTHAANVGLGGIAVGPEGAFWFSFGGRSEIGRITTAGQISRFGLPAGMRPAEIVAGPDGNFWFTIEGSRSIGRVTTAGAVTELFLPEGDSPAAGIALGPDGALWATEPLSGRIARIGTDGSVGSFLPPDPGGYPIRIVAGPDGNLWYGKRMGGVLGRIAPSGAASALPVPEGRQTYALASGPEGDLWYSNGGGRVGSMTVGGETADQACVGSCRAPITALVQGPEGKLWFAAGTEPGAPPSTPGTVGTFTPPLLEAAFVDGPEQRGRRVALRVRCQGGAAGNRCEGKLRLLGRVPGLSGPLAERPLRLALGAERAFSLRLPAAVTRLLAERRRLVLRATTNVAAGKHSVSPIVLR